MKRIVFIDANIYLRFYDSNFPDFTDLLSSLDAIKTEIFLTEQVRNEVYRNRLKVFLDSATNHLNSLQFKSVRLPEHIGMGSAQSLKQINKDIATINKKASQVKGKLKMTIGKLLGGISNGIDDVSVALEPIFETAKVASADQFSRARLRKEIGNPPGKKGDTLGDQLSWEQLLEQITGIKELYIISADADYGCTFENSVHLNPFLKHELKNANKSLKIFGFVALAEALKKLNTSKRIPSLPKASKLDAIADQEKNTNSSRVIRASFNPFYTMHTHESEESEDTYQRFFKRDGTIKNLPDFASFFAD